MENTTSIRRVADRIMRHPLMRDIPFETIIDYTIDFIQILNKMGFPKNYKKLLNMRGSIRTISNE